MLTNVSFDNLDRDRLLVEDKDANIIDSPISVSTTTESRLATDLTTAGQI